MFFVFLFAFIVHVVAHFAERHVSHDLVVASQSSIVSSLVCSATYILPFVVASFLVWAFFMVSLVNVALYVFCVFVLRLAFMNVCYRCHVAAECACGVLSAAFVVFAVP